MTTAVKGTDNYFKIDLECRLFGDMDHVNYFPGVQRIKTK
jgi:hypothetical protein